MKKSTILWLVLLVASGVFAIRIGLVLSGLPGQFKVNWLVAVPLLAVFTALVGSIVRRKLAAAEAQPSPSLFADCRELPLVGHESQS